jgi:hypothetical protein
LNNGRRAIVILLDFNHRKTISESKFSLYRPTYFGHPLSLPFLASMPTAAISITFLAVVYQASLKMMNYYTCPEQQT